VAAKGEGRKIPLLWHFWEFDKLMDLEQQFLTLWFRKPNSTLHNKISTIYFSIERESPRGSGPNSGARQNPPVPLVVDCLDKLDDWLSLYHIRNFRNLV